MVPHEFLTRNTCYSEYKTAQKSGEKRINLFRCTVKTCLHVWYVCVHVYVHGVCFVHSCPCLTTIIYDSINEIIGDMISIFMPPRGMLLS